MRQIPGRGEEVLDERTTSAFCSEGPFADGEGVGPLRQCPVCGEPSPDAVFDGGQWNFLCRGCGTCSHVDASGMVTTVDPLSCPGCRLRDFCPASPSPVAQSLTHRAVLRDGLPVTIRPLVHSDLPALCGLAARARAEAGRGAVTDLLAGTFCDVRDVDPDRFTWVAVTDDGRELPIALASFSRCEEDSTCARAALGVDSAYRGRGVAELLYQRLAESAESHGVEFLRTIVSLHRPDDIGELAALGLHARALGGRSAELHWSLNPPLNRDRLVALLSLLERTVVEPIEDPNPVSGAHWIE